MASDQKQVEMAFAKQQHSPSATPPPSFKPSPCGIHETKLRRAELFLRLVTFIASVFGFAFLITDKQSRSFTIFQSVIIKEARFSDMKAVVFCVISLAIVAVYSVFQVVRSFCAASGSSMAWAIFLLDQVMAYFLLSSSAAAAQSAYFSEQGNDSFGWPKVCYLYEHFCKQVGAGVIGSYVAFVGLVFTSAISAFNVFASPSIQE